LRVLCGWSEVVLGVAVVVNGDRGSHDALAIGRDAVETSAWNLGDEPVTTELDDEPGDSFASSMRLSGVGGWSSVEACCEVGVAEPDDV
jgi:hypothetical protein